VTGDWGVNLTCGPGEVPPLRRMDCGGGVRELVGIGGLLTGAGAVL
jgi:hypothetical protein